MGETVKSDKIYSNSFYFFNGPPKLYKFNIEKLQWQFEVQSNFYAVYSRPIVNITNFFAVCELIIFLYKKIRMYKINFFSF